MSKIETITADVAVAANEVRISIANLTVSEMNPRQDVPEADVIELSESLMAAGLIQNIAGFGDETGAEIVAGGRRLRALQYLAQKHENLAETRPDLAFPLVLLAPDKATAQLWANTENVARRDLTPAEEIRAYGKMEQAGSPADAIARAFAVTEKHVYRRLSLANLPEAVIDALEAGEINLSAAACFTISNDDEQSLKVLERIKGGNYSDYNIKQYLKPESVRGSDRTAKFVGEADYKEAGGVLGGDLFAEELLFDSPDVLAECFTKKLTEAANAKMEAEGWKWVDVYHDDYIHYWLSPFDKYEEIRPIRGELTEQQGERYDELEELANSDVIDEAGEAELSALEAILEGEYTDDQKQVAGVVVYVGRGGELKVSDAYVKPEDQDEAVKAGVLASKKATVAPKKEKPAFTQSFVDDMVAIRLAATQTALLRKPEYLLDLFGFSVSDACDSFHHVFGHGYAGAEVNSPSVDDNFSLDPRLGGERDEEAQAAYDSLRKMSKQGAVESFNSFREEGKKLRNGQMTAYLAKRFLTQKADFMALIMEEIGANIREIWTPSETNCFKRLNGDQLNGIFGQLLDLGEGSEALKVFIKSKKGEKAKSLHKLFHDVDFQKQAGVTAAQKARIDAWVPACFG